MIPYDDLVAALSAWRARQGLPVSTMGAMPSGQSSSGSGPMAAQPMAKSPSGPKTAPPPARVKGSTVPPPLAMPDTVEEVDEAAMIDESSYENEGDDFAMKFGGQSHASKDSATEIGGPPVRDSVTTDPVGGYPPARGGKKTKPEDEW
jgi:hypothetical protein